MRELWNNISDFVDYSVSSLGRVKSHKKDKKGKIMSLMKKPSGYLCVNLMKDGRMYQRLVHRLVAKEFVEGYQDGFIVNHKNFNKEDNKSSNLEWVDSRG